MATRFRRVLVLLCVCVLSLAFSTEAVACLTCAYSPNRFGFCKGGAMRGYAWCEQCVADSWTGRTDCYRGGICDAGGGYCDYYVYNQDYSDTPVECEA